MAEEPENEHERDLARDREENDKKRIDEIDERIASAWREQNERLDRLTKLVEESLTISRDSMELSTKTSKKLEEMESEESLTETAEKPPENEEDQESLVVTMPEVSMPALEEKRPERRLMRRGL